ncbi:hypothetical protein WDU94_011613 [Cyamophila willieti]
MSDPMIKKLSSNDFIVEKFVKELSQHCVGGLELQQKRVEIGALAEETNTLLKKNVFHNYMLFIETAKEISHLEGEMYQLSHLLTEQRSLLATLAHSSIVEGVAPLNTSVNTSVEQDKETQARKQLNDIMQKVEGCVPLLDSPRVFILEGDLIELDPLENKPLRRVHAYLLSDMLILACPIQGSQGRYQLSTCYDNLTSLAVVNIRHIAAAFKLLAFPDTRVFQAPSASGKKEWLDKFEEIKKSNKDQNSFQSKSDPADSPGNPFEQHEDEEDEEEEESGASEDLPSPSPSIPEWLQEVPEDLDVLIVERHFEDAYNLIEKTREYLNENKTSTGGRESLDAVFVTDMSKKLDARVDTLTAMLTKELKVTPENTRGSPSAHLRPRNQYSLRDLALLISLTHDCDLFLALCSSILRAQLKRVSHVIPDIPLNKTSLSCDLFLALCSSILRAQLKRVRRDGPALNYVSSASTVFFTNLSLMTTELQKVAFPGTGECAAAFVVWATREFNLFVSYVIRELFVTQSSLSSLSPCIAAVSTKCDQLTSLGLDLRYLLDGALRGPLTKALKETRDKLTDTIKLRCSEDKWKPFNLNNRQQRDKFLAEFSEAGLASMTSYLTGDCWLRLSNNTILFTRLYLSLLQDCFNLANSDLLYNIEDTLYIVMQHQLKHVDASLRNDQLADEREFIVQNADFILNNLLALCEKKFEQNFKFKSKKLAQVRKEFQHLA